MPNGTPSRSDGAPRDEEPRAERAPTPLVAYASLLGQADTFFEDADKQETRFQHSAFAAIRKGAFAAMSDGYLEILHLLPRGDDRDLMILAGHASMMADQLNAQIPEGPEWKHADALTKGIAAALVAISATLAAQWPAGADSIAPLFPELARSIRRDMSIVAALRENPEGR